MREIKFRAYDKFNDCHWYSDKYKTLGDFFTTMQRLIDGGNELVFEQYTGIKDKNGKEIYEGDILKCENRDIVCVSYETIYASFGIWKKGWAFLHYFHETVEPEECQVIGNIHDNPELLNS